MKLTSNSENVVGSLVSELQSYSRTTSVTVNFTTNNTCHFYYPTNALNYIKLFFSPGATTPSGVVFYSPLAGFSLLAYEVS